MFSKLTLFFTLFLSYLSLYEELILGGDLGGMRYLYNIVEGALLVKLILKGRALKLGERFEKPPLVIPTLFKAFVFTLFVGLLTVLEHVLLHHLKAREVVDAMVGRLLLCFILFIFLFSFLEIGRFV